jgi:hypothetical protein
VVIEQFGTSAFFAYTSSLHGAFIAVILFRMTRRGTVPDHVKTRLVALLRTSPLIFRPRRPATPRAPVGGPGTIRITFTTARLSIGCRLG